MEALDIAQVASDVAHPKEGLRAVASLRLLVETLEFRQVEAGLRAGMTWNDVAAALGISRQAAHKKYSGRIAPTIQVPRRNRK